MIFRLPKTNSKQPTNQQIPFGVHNLNVCNIQSACVIDLKIFLYSTYYQSLSYLKRFGSFTLEPFYHPQSIHMCTSRQSDWWSVATKLIITNNLTRKTLWWERQFDEPVVPRLDTKILNDLNKTLELIRLKSSSIKLGISRFKVNVRICSQIAKYLQYLCDCLSQPVVARKSLDGFEDENIRYKSN